MEKINLNEKKTKQKKLIRIMKCCLFFIFLGIGSCFANETYSQKTFFTFEYNNRTVKEIINEIEQNSEFIFFYLDNSVNLNRKVSVKVENEGVEKVLDQIFAGTKNQYYVSDRQIVIASVKTPESSVKILSQQPQGRTITGVVSDAEGPIIGANVVVKGTTNGAVTDINGQFTISNVPTNAILQISYIGYIPQEVNSTTQIRFDIILREDVAALEEVVVVGYGVQRKSDVTGAIAKIETGDIQNRSITDANQALQGKTAGVQLISSAGAPGATTDVQIRGISSNSGSSPLYIVDGVQVRNIGFIEPNNIESMEVLKDAASAAIYGAQAGNGVILITTKRGSGTAQGTIMYDGQYVFNNITRVPKMLNAADYQTYMLEAGYLNQEFINANWDGKTDSNWGDIAFETGFSHRHNLSFSQAGEQGTFYASLSYLNQDGPVVGKEDVSERWTFLVNAERKIKSWLKVGVNFTYNRSQTLSVVSNYEFGSVLTAVLSLDPLTPFYWPTINDVPASYKEYAENGLLLSNNKGFFAESPFLIASNPNPLTIVNRSHNAGYNNSTNGTLFADLTPIKDLVITTRLSIQTSNRMGKNYNAPYFANSNAFNYQPTLSRNANESFFYQWENFANYRKRIGNHDITTMAGVSFSQTHRENLGTGSIRLLSDDPLYRDFSWQHPDATKNINGSYADAAQFSYFGRLNYSFANKYMAQITFRADAFDTSKLSSQTRWGYFPAISAGWIISDEEFMKPLHFISNLKLRASWGVNGSIRALYNYQYASSMATAANRQYDFTPDRNTFSYTTSYYPDKLSNPNLKWETSTQLNFGIDSRLLNNRLTFSIDWFNKKTEGLLVAATPPVFTGFSSMWVNGGNIDNRGFEFDLGWKDKISDFSYGVKANLATLRNRVTYLDPTITRINGTGFFNVTDRTVMEAGYPIWYLRGWVMEGIDPNDGEPIFKDLDGNGVINELDKTMLGSGLADFTYGITFSASWKNIDFLLFGNGSYGNDMYLCLYRPDFVTGNRIQLFFDDRWTESNRNATQPRPGTNEFHHYIASSAMVFSGSYFKIKQIQLGYSVPRKLLRKLMINDLRVYLSLDDFFCFTSYPGFDPEISVNTRTEQDEVTGSGIGIDKGAYPVYNKTTLGINITF